MLTRGRLPRCARSAPGRAPHGACRRPALAGGVHEEELLVVYDDEVDAVRAVRSVLLQDLNAPVLQVRADCLMRPLVNALSHGRLASRVGGSNLKARRSQCTKGLPK